MQRYSVKPWDIRRADMVRDDDGEYVRHDDAEAAIRAARNAGMREAARLCEMTTMEIPMKAKERRLAGMFAASVPMPGEGTHHGMGYAALILAAVEADT